MDYDDTDRAQPSATEHQLHLIEMALRDRGVQPLVVRSAEQLGELAALQFLPPVSGSPHGDYTAAGTMRNTDVELKEYPEPTVRWLERLFGDHGVLVAGWSTAYDKRSSKFSDR